MHALRLFWQARTARERLLLGGGIVLLAALLFYADVWQPLQQQRLQLRARLPRLRAEAALMRAQLGGVAALRARAGTALPGDLRAAIAQSARAQGMAPPPVVLRDPAHADITFKSAPYRQVSAFLVQLQKQYRVKPASVHLSAAVRGRVDGQLSLVAPGAGA